jgi:hypothetical protein
MPAIAGRALPGSADYEALGIRVTIQMVERLDLEAAAVVVAVVGKEGLGPRWQGGADGFLERVTGEP